MKEAATGINQKTTAINQREERQNFLKIEGRLRQTERNNGNKIYYDKFILRNCRMDSLPQLSYDLLTQNKHLKKLKQLDLSEMDLRSLKNLPAFEYLKKLNLIMNFIEDPEIKYLFKYKTLEILYLSENFIRDHSTVLSLKAFPVLREIDLSCNPVKYDRNELFRILDVKIIDRYTKSGSDLERNRLLEEDGQDQLSGSDQSDSEQDQQSDDGSEEGESEMVNEQSDIILMAADPNQMHESSDQLQSKG